MTAPPGGVEALERCLERRDYAGAGRLVTAPRVLEELRALTAERAYRRSVAQWRAEHEATVRERRERAVGDLVALLAAAFRTPPDVPPVSAREAARNRERLADSLREGRPGIRDHQRGEDSR